MQEACVHDGHVLPKLYAKVHHCVSWNAIHAHIVSVRSCENRRNCELPQHFRYLHCYWTTTYRLKSFSFSTHNAILLKCMQNCTDLSFR
ncbi:hypothetical protein DAI22_03g389900 [Oryza sativa Japonica Group]|nr:hypothetical protein DAI22_03g389900 [Oryza sativa Japonica Group]